jgi:hypothetical protein
MFAGLANWSFAAAGLLCAALPLLIHYLSRRRYRELEWGAMQFVLEAMQHSQRALALRDRLLLLLRMAAVALFGLALARPYLTARDEPFVPGEAVHAVLLIDNSLSMGYHSLSGTALDQAKRRAGSVIEQLPAGSRITLVPLCGRLSPASVETHSAKATALEELAGISVVDRSTGMRQALNEIRRLAALPSELPKQYVVFGDRQQLNWQDVRGGLEPDVPHLQFVDVETDMRENTWVASVGVADGVADADTPATIVAEIRHCGQQPRGDVRVTLWVDGREADSQLVRLAAPGARQEVTFAHDFREFQPETSQQAFVPIKVTLSPDRLPDDDERHGIVPVVASLPVVFVDQYGADEEYPAANRLGETRHLRRLLAPSAAGESGTRPFIHVRHVRMGQLDRLILSDSRLVVVAGVAEPGQQVDLLREFVEQGGQLFVAAGGNFDPAAWNDAAWHNGAGILPLPLLPTLAGAVPRTGAPAVQPLHLFFESLEQHPYFRLPGNSEASLRDLFAEPFFFQIVQVDESADVIAELRGATRRQLARQLDERTASEAGSPNLPSGNRWLQWAAPISDQAPIVPDSDTQRQRWLAAATEARQPRVLARYSSQSGPAFLVERNIGRGRVLLATTGVLSDWNTLPHTHAMVLFDRILREMIQVTMPSREFGPTNRIDVAIPEAYRSARVVLRRPGTDADEELDSGFLKHDELGVTIDRPLRRGLYRVVASSNDGFVSERDGARSEWRFDAAVNGDPQESDLTALDPDSLAASLPGDWRWLRGEDPVSLAGAGLRGRGLWWWLALSVLLVVLAESAVLAAGSWQAFRRTGKRPAER